MNEEKQRIVIAEATGLEIRGIGKDGWYCSKCGYVQPEHVTYEETHDPRAGGCGSRVDVPSPNYPEDLNACADLANLMAERGWNCDLNNGLNKTWECIFKRPTKERTDTTREDYDGTLWEEHYHPADTMARAICGAFLRTIGKWED